MKQVSWVTRAIPRRLLPHYGNVLLDTVRQEPGPGAALLQGLFFGRIAPHRSERRTFQTPALVIGHRRDPVHPFSDAGMLAEELPDSRLLEADSLVELRLNPERLTGEIADFLDEVWSGPQRKPAARPQRSKPATARRAGTVRPR
jgi:pimeloyl-ACP methyl ester carboxylesterase